VQPSSSTILHEDSFYEFFRPYRHPSAAYNIWGGLGLEIHGSDYKLVHSLPPDHVWTVLDGSSGADQWISPGVHYVNRVCLLVTEVSHRWAPFEFRVPSRGSGLTPLGLKRQYSRIRTIINVYYVGS
jgi:hypothetical protein